MNDNDAPRQNMRCTIAPWELATPSGGYDRVVRARVPFRYVIVPPMRRISPPRPIAMIEAEIARAVVPGLRREDV